MADDPRLLNLDDMDFGPTIRGHQKGDRVFDRFVLQKLLGRGGMGVVWLAIDERLRREVALKFAPQVVRYDDLAVEELKEETRKGLDLAHPHIVKIYDFLLDEENAAISMEYIDGENLGSLRTRQAAKFFEPREIRQWVDQFLSALDYAHTHAEVIHRDIKPANLMVDKDGHLRITDFGIARSITDAMNRATLASGNSTGTLAYMSPQQAEGRKPQISDDLYAVGSTLYELITGKPPFHSGNIALQLRHEPATSPTERRREFGLTNAEPIPPEWEQTILACLEKEPANRPASAGEIRNRLGFTSAPVAPVIPSQPPTLKGSISVPPPLSPKQETATTPPISEPVITTSTSAQVTGSTNASGGSSGGIWVVVVLIVLFLGLAAFGAAGWWVYNNTPFFKTKKATISFTSPKDKDPVKPLVKEDPQPPKVDTKPKPPAQDDESKKPTEDKPIPVDPPAEDKPPVMVNTDPKPPVADNKPAVFTTVQNAIDQAKAGDTVSIPDGTYDEQIRFKNGIHLKAANTGRVIIQTDGNSGSALMSEACREGSITGIQFQHTGDDVATQEAWPVVFLKSSTLKLEGCIFQKGVGDGLLVAGASQCQITQCIFRNNARNGLVLESGASARVIDCEARKNGASGVEVRLLGATPSFENIILESNGGSGLVVKDSATASVTGNSVSRSNQEAGFAAAGEGVSLTVDKALCEGNLVGISIQESAFANLTNNTIRQSREVGLHFDNAQTKSLASNNTVEKNKLDGIFATGDAGTTLLLTGNRLLTNGGNGILVFGAGFLPEMAENHAETNAQHGILVAEKADGIIHGNTFQGNHLGEISTEDAGKNLEIK